MAKLDTRRLNQILHNVDGDVYNVVKSIGFAIEALAKVKAPVDTGALVSSIYTRAKNANPFPRLGEVPVELPQPREGEVNVGPSVHYGIWQELGTSRMAAQPYLLPAVEQITDELNRFHRQMGRALGDG